MVSWVHFFVFWWCSICFPFTLLMNHEYSNVWILLTLIIAHKNTTDKYCHLLYVKPHRTSIKPCPAHLSTPLVSYKKRFDSSHYSQLSQRVYTEIKTTRLTCFFARQGVLHSKVKIKYPQNIASSFHPVITTLRSVFHCELWSRLLSFLIVFRDALRVVVLWYEIYPFHRNLSGVTLLMNWRLELLSISNIHPRDTQY